MNNRPRLIPAWRRALFGTMTLAMAIGFAAVVVPAGVVSPRSVEHLVLAPTFLPYVLTGLIGLFGAIHAIFGLRSPELGDVAEAVDTCPAWLVRLPVVSALIASYWLLPETIGMLASAVGVTSSLLWLGDERRWQVFLGVAVLLPTAVYVFFVWVVQVPLPAGNFFR